MQWWKENFPDDLPSTLCLCTALFNFVQTNVELQD